MKNFIVTCLMALSVAIVPAAVHAQTPSSSIKAAKSRAKQLKKEKWICEDNKDLEDALVDMAKKEAEGYRVLFGTNYANEDQNDAAFEARKDAFEKMGEFGKTVITGRVVSNRQKRGNNTSKNGDAAFDRHLMRELEGLMDAPYLTLSRERKGMFDYRIYYVVHPSLIEKAAAKAEDAASSEMGNAKKYGDGVSDFINGGM